jgi:ribonuclease HI
VAALEAEANLMPLAIRRKAYLTRYVSRILTVRDHPVRNLILEYYPFNFYQTQPRPLPVTGLAYEELLKVGLNYDNLPLLGGEAPYCLPPLLIKKSLQQFSKPQLSDKAWRQLCSDLLSQYPFHKPVYCDGSRCERGSAAAVWAAGVSLLAHLSDYSSVLSTELYAIYIATSFFSSREGNLLIFTDSLSSINSFSNLHPKSHFLAFCIATLLSKKPTKLTIEWVPSHVGIEGNEIADQLARQAVNHP